MKHLSSSKVIKGISHKHFFVELMERNTGHYYVQYKRRLEPRVIETENVRDYVLASTLFEMIIQEVQGN